MLSYAGGGQAIYENGIFSRHKFDYKPSKGPNAGEWTPIWKTNKAGELVRDVNALPEEGYLVLKNSKNTVAKYNLGKTVSRAGKVLGALGMVATIADGLDGSKGGWKNHHTADLIIGAAMTFGPVGWIGGLTQTFSSTYLYNKLYWYIPGAVILGVVYLYFNKVKTKAIIEKYSASDNFYSIGNILLFLLLILMPVLIIVKIK